jgi:ribonuclease HIII
LPDTFVARLDPTTARRLYEEVGRGVFAFRSVPHATWSAKGEEVVVTLYTSGKLVVQGRGTSSFVARHLEGVSSSQNASDDREALPLRGPTIGSDEAGKGDYFGPLVVAAALVRPEDLAVLSECGVQDSKASTDARIRRVEGRLAEGLVHAVRVLLPEDYNEAYQQVGNLNVLLGRLHAEVIDEVLARSGDAAPRIVVDRFGDPRHVRDALSDEARARPLAMPTGGEANPAVAAASFFARAAFLREFERLRGLAGGELYLGASDPRIVPLARRLLREGGRPWLGQFAKLHFKTTMKL